MNNSTSPAYRIISWEDFQAQFDVQFSMPFEDFSEALADILLYEADADGNVRFTEDFTVGSDINVVIHGNLIVDGNLEMDCEGMGNFMYVSGHVEANSIVVCGVATLSVDGDIQSKHGILGCYGDDGGYLNVGGDITTPVLINTTYFNMFLKNYDGAVVIDLVGGFLETEYTGEENAATILHPDVMDEADNIEIPRIWQALQAGKPVVKSSE
jgi:hypothetical protein